MLSNPKASKYIKEDIVKLPMKFQLSKYTSTQVFHAQIDHDGIEAYVLEAMQNSGYQQLNAWDNSSEHFIRITKKGKVLYSKRRCESRPATQASHNREKSYIFKEGMIIPPLVDMGVFSESGKIIKPMYDKYRQVNRFIELIDDEIKRTSQDEQDTFNIIDFGCGKSYLTFVIYYYFVYMRKINVNIVGLDLKSDVIERCNETAEKYGYTNLRFELGDINGYQPSQKIDMVISLHACDTATDHAIFNAIQWKAKYIFSVPCCQHELNKQMKTENYTILTRYGLVQERNGLRGVIQKN